MKVIIDEEECVGCQTCSELCPEVFRFVEEKDKAEVIMPEGGSKDCIDEAIDACAVSAIHWQS